EVVDLAVEDDHARSRSVGHRLPPRAEVDDRQPRHAEGGLAVDPRARVVGPAVGEERQHRRHEVGRRGADPARDAAHQRPPLTSSRRPSTRAAVRSEPKSGARASPRLRRSAARPASLSARAMPDVIAASLTGSTRSPASATTSGSAPRFDATTGLPHAIASSAGSPNVTGITVTFDGLTPSRATTARREYSESATIAAARQAYRRASARAATS